MVRGCLHVAQDTHCDPVKPDCVFDITSWTSHPDVDGPVLKCKTHGLLAPGEIYDRAFTEDA